MTKRTDPAPEPTMTFAPGKTLAQTGGPMLLWLERLYATSPGFRAQVDAQKQEVEAKECEA